MPLEVTQAATSAAACSIRRVGAGATILSHALAIAALATTSLAPAVALAAGPASAPATTGAGGNQAPPATPTAAPHPFPPLARPVFLPALAYTAGDVAGDAAGDAACDGWIHVQSAGDEPSRAVLIWWADAHDGEVGCVRPAGAMCSGLLGPGSVWRFRVGGAGDGASSAASAASAVVLSFNVRSLAQIGAAPGDETLVAEWLCQAAADGLTASCEGYRALREAYDQGGTYAGVPLAFAYGAPLVAHVERGCRSGVEKLARHASGYNGIAASGGVEELLPIQSFRAGPAYGPDARRTTVVHVQNRSVNDASVEAWFKSDDACGQLRLCRRPFMLPPGRSARFDLTGCAAPSSTGSVVVTSAERAPLAVVVDVVGADHLTSDVAVPAEFKASIAGPPLFTPGSPVVFGPLVRTALDGGALHVLNLDAARPARLRITVHDPWGSPEGPPIERVICPGGGATVTLPRTADVDAGAEPGSIRVESVPDAPDVPDAPIGSATVEAPPNVSAVVTLRDAVGPYGMPAASYPLLPEAQAFRWPAGAGKCGSESGVALIALPAVGSDVDRVYIANAVPYLGLTQVAIMLFDQNGRIGGVCRPVAAQQTIALNMTAHGLQGTGWRGGALVSAAWWSHAIIDNRRVVRNVVGLTALVAHRPPDADLGDSMTAAVGIPQRPNRDVHVGRIAGAGPIELGCPWPPPRRDMGSDCRGRPERVWLPRVGVGK